MDAVNAWDVALLAVASYIAVTSLLKLMIARRNTLAVELRAELEVERKRIAKEKAKQQPEAKPRRRRTPRGLSRLKVEQAARPPTESFPWA